MNRTEDRRSRTTTVRTLANALVLTVALAGAASAQQQQPASAGTPPVSVGPGWRYEKRSLERADLHQFWCQQPDCGPHSVVSYVIYAPSPPMRLEQYRQSQASTLTALRERAAPGTKITELGLKGDDTGKLPSMFEVRRLTELPDGKKEYRVSSTLLGTKYSATLISTSEDEQAATANHALFAVAVMMFITKPPS
jgi:hypothetical protein